MSTRVPGGSTLGGGTTTPGTTTVARPKRKPGGGNIQRSSTGTNLTGASTRITRDPFKGATALSPGSGVPGTGTPATYSIPPRPGSTWGRIAWGMAYPGADPAGTVDQPAGADRPLGQNEAAPLPYFNTGLEGKPGGLNPRPSISFQINRRRRARSSVWSSIAGSPNAGSIA